MRLKLAILFLILHTLAHTLAVQAQEPMVKIALLQYSGGGDWYSNPTSLPNLVAFCNNQLNTNISNDIPTVEVGSPEIFNYPLVHMTGHGNVVFSAQEADNLRTYLAAGGFLHIDDNYGMKPYILPQISIIFPEYELVEIPYSHAIFHQTYSFPNGLPKIHEHDNKPPQAFGIFIEGRLVLLYTFECDLGDGWEDQAVHGDSQETRLKALQMGANIIQYVFEGE